MPTSLRLEIFPADLNATVRFYVDLLGFTVVEDRRADPLPAISLARDGFRLGAVAVPGGFAAHRHPPEDGLLGKEPGARVVGDSLEIHAPAEPPVGGPGGQIADRPAR